MKNNLFQAFSEKAFVYLWIGEIFTQIAANFFNFFLIVLVYTLTKSNTAVSGAVITFTLPAIFFGILAGAYTDRWEKKKVLIIANLFRAALLIILMLFHRNVVVVYLFSFFISIATQFFIPAETPMIPLVVDKKYLFSANALFGLGIFGSILLAYVISGPVITYLHYQNTLLFLAVCFIIGAIFISFIRMPREEKKEEGKDIQKTIIKDVKEVIALLVKTKAIYSSVFLLALSQILTLTIAVVAPGYATQVLKITIEKFSYVFVVPAALGVVIGSVLLSNRFQHVRKEKLVSIGLFLSSFSMVLLPFGSEIATRGVIKFMNTILPAALQINNIHILVFLALLLGLGNALVFVPSNTLLQEKTTDEFRGKIYGVINTTVGIFSFFPILAVGGLSDLVGVGTVIIGIGILLFFIGVGNSMLHKKPHIL